ncbi:MAG TPA: hypothetical protein VII01_08770, partial [Solirubrobacteraceae bacterium]
SEKCRWIVSDTACWSVIWPILARGWGVTDGGRTGVDVAWTSGAGCDALGDDDGAAAPADPVPTTGAATSCACPPELPEAAA